MLLEHNVDEQTGELLLRAAPPAVFHVPRLRELLTHLEHMVSALEQLERDRATQPTPNVDGALLQTIYALAAELYTTTRSRAMVLELAQLTVRLGPAACGCPKPGANRGCLCIAAFQGAAFNANAWCTCTCHLPVSTTR